MSEPLQTAPNRTWRIAVLEDDTQLRECILLPGLRYFGFQVTGSGNAAELYRNMLAASYDIVVLDIGLPGEDGISILKHLRSMSNIGVVMLTANADVNDQLESLREGADAFLKKPVDIHILAATLHSLARRLAPADAAVSTSVACGKWRLDTEDWCLVTPAGQPLPLSAPERCVLSLLMRESDEPVSRERLIAALTSDIYDFDPHRLEMMIYRLRRKVLSAAGLTLPLLTARGRGYLFRRDG
ncbi:response regulator transcription factor [Dyella telluris]|uniref:Response regulator transcription factor n=1 Tax=Dyella telluris TaxID=2763498 RepID=A0A7G8Q3B2_9GAMM|nr:response regulator transcription factor [Dyella telluris]QNK01270.1 response regulator transcription factor [Dyella telluris]